MEALWYDGAVKQFGGVDEVIRLDEMDLKSFWM